MKTLAIDILEDCTNTGGFGVEGYKIRLTTNVASVDAFINMKNIVTAQTDWLHALFANPPYSSEFVKKADSAIQDLFKNWNTEIKTLQIKAIN